MAKSKGHDFTHQEFNELWKKIESRYEKETEKKLRPNEYVEVVTHLRKFSDVNIHLPGPKENEGQTIYRAYLESQKPVNKAPIITIAVDFAQALIAYAEGMAVTPLDDYYTYLRSFYIKKGNLGEESLSLQDIYIEPQVNNIHNRPIQLLDEIVTWLKGENITSNTYNNFHLILGDPGQGKTSFCYRILYEISGRIERPVYYCRLRYIDNIESFYENPFDAIFNYLIEYGYSKDNKNFNRTPINRKSFENSVLILDGFDEVEKIYNLDKDNLCVEIAKSSMKLITPYRVLLTSRKELELHKIRRNNISYSSILELSIDEQWEWINKYNHKSKEPYLLTYEALEKLNDTLHALSPLMRQPILLHILAQLNIQPNSKYNSSKVYDELFNRMIDRSWAKFYDSENLPHILNDFIPTPERLRELLHLISLEMFIRNSIYLSHDQIPTAVLNTLGLNENQGNNALKIMSTAFYFNYYIKGDNKDKSYYLEFIHKTFGEYLIAEAIWTGVNNIFNNEKLSNDIVFIETTALLNGKSKLPVNVDKFLSEIIINNRPNPKKPTQNQDLLKLNIESYFSHFFNNDFIFSFEKGEFKIEKSLNTFYNLMCVYFRICDANILTVDGSLNRHFDFGLNLIKYIYAFCSFNDNIRFYNFNFRGCNLPRLNLNSSTLDDSDFSHGDLQASSFVKSSMIKSIFIKSKLNFSNFSGANCEFTNFSRASMRYCDLGHSRFYYSKFFRADLTGADLTGAMLRNSYFHRTNFTRANLKSVDLEAADLSYSNFTEATGLTFKSLLVAKSLYKCVGIEENLLNKLKANHPRLFIKHKRSHPQHSNQ